jgi:hypothetical protein
MSSKDTSKKGRAAGRTPSRNILQNVREKLDRVHYSTVEAGNDYYSHENVGEFLAGKPSSRPARAQSMSSGSDKKRWYEPIKRAGTLIGRRLQPSSSGPGYQAIPTDDDEWWMKCRCGREVGHEEACWATDSKSARGRDRPVSPVSPYYDDPFRSGPVSPNAPTPPLRRLPALPASMAPSHGTTGVDAADLTRRLERHQLRERARAGIADAAQTLQRSGAVHDPSRASASASASSPPLSAATLRLSEAAGAVERTCSRLHELHVRPSGSAWIYWNREGAEAVRAHERAKREHDELYRAWLAEAKPESTQKRR